MNNLLKISILTMTAFGTASCGGTTGGLTNALAQKAASQAVTTAMKRNAASTNDLVTPNAISVAAKPGDAQLSCEAIATKVAELDSVIVEKGEIAGLDISIAGQQALTAGIAQAAVSTGAVSGMASSVPFVGMFGQMAAGQVQKSKEKKVKKARKVYQAATGRRATLMGVYAGKGCGA